MEVCSRGIGGVFGDDLRISKVGAECRMYHVLKTLLRHFDYLSEFAYSLDRAFQLVDVKRSLKVRQAHQSSMGG